TAIGSRLIHQQATGNTAAVTMVNGGNIDVSAQAIVNGPGGPGLSAKDYVHLRGAISQSAVAFTGNGANASFANEAPGKVNIGALATLTAAAGTAEARAT